MSRGGYSEALDLWSAGCVLGELLQRTLTLGKASTPHLQVGFGAVRVSGCWRGGGVSLCRGWSLHECGPTCLV